GEPSAAHVDGKEHAEETRLVKRLRDLDGKLCRMLGALGVRMDERCKLADTLEVDSGPVGDGIGHGSPSGARAHYRVARSEGNRSAVAQDARRQTLHQAGALQTRLTLTPRSARPARPRRWAGCRRTPSVGARYGRGT